jgi:hypothetical protein
MRPIVLVPRRQCGGLVALSVLIGAVLGAVDLFLTFDPLPLLCFGAGFLLVPSVLLGALLALRCRRVVVVLVCGFALDMTRTLVEMTCRLATTTDQSLTFMNLRDLARTLGVLGAEGVVAGSLLSLLGFGALRLSLRIKEGDGTACWWCLYEHNSPGATLCPECTRPLDESQCRIRWVHLLGAWCQRRRLWLNIPAALVALCLVVAYVAVNRRPRPEADAFVAQFEKIGEVTPGFMRPTPSATPVAGVGALIETSAPPRVVWVVYLARDVAGLPAMQLQVHFRMGGLIGDTFREASPRVLCDLDRGQAEWIIAHGLPAGLTEAMASRASPGWSTGADVTIDPRDYLPREASQP